MERQGHGLILDTTPAVSWGTRGKNKKNLCKTDELQAAI